MKKIFVVLCLLFLVSFCFAQEVSLGDDSVDWTVDVDAFKGLDSATKNNNWEGLKSETKNWAATHLASDIRDGNGEGPSLETIKFVGAEGLQWEEGDAILSDGKENGVRIDLEKISPAVTEISYDEETGIATYTYENGGNVSIKNGMIDNESYVNEELGIGTKSKVKLNVSNGGTIAIDENGKFGIENGASVKVGDRKFMSALDDEGSLVIGDNSFEIKNLGVDTNKFHMSVLPIEGDKPFHLAFGEPEPGEYDGTENGAWIYDSGDSNKMTVKMKGENVVTDFKESWLTGGETAKVVSVEADGKGLVFGIGGVDFAVDGEKTFAPREAQDLENFGGEFELKNMNQKPGEDGEIPVYSYGSLEGFGVVDEEEPPVAIVSDSPKPVVETPPIEPIIAIESDAAKTGADTRVCIGECPQLAENPLTRGYFEDSETAITRGFGNNEQIEGMPSDLKGAAILEEFSSKEYDKELEIDLTLEKIPKAGRATTEGAQAIRGFVTKEKFLTDLKKEAEVLPEADRVIFGYMVDGLSSQLAGMKSDGTYDKNSDYRQNHKWVDEGMFSNTNREVQDVIFKDTKLNIVVPGEGRGDPYAVFTLTKPKSGVPLAASKANLLQGRALSIYGIIQETETYKTVRLPIDKKYSGLLREITSTGVIKPDKFDPKTTTTREWRGIITEYEKTH